MNIVNFSFLLKLEFQTLTAEILMGLDTQILSLHKCLLKDMVVCLWLAGLL